MGVPDFIQRAIEAQGTVKVEEVRDALDDPALIPPDEQAVAQQHAESNREHGCCECGDALSARDPNVLWEVVGWERKRKQGGQNHVRFRAETGRVMCGRCALLMRDTGTSGQGTLT